MAHNVHNTTRSNENIIIGLFDGAGENRCRHLTQFKVFAIFVGGWECLFNIDNYVKEIIDIINNNSGIKKIIITGICKHANLALELAYRLKGLKQFEDIKVGVFGTPFLVGCHKCTTTYHRGTPLTPALDNSLKQFPGLDKLVKQYGDYITIVNAHDKSEQDAIKIYALVTYNKDNWTLELENFQTPEIRKSLSGALLIETPQLNTDKCHGAIIHLVLNDTSNKLIQNYLSKAFQNL
jgi:hypothetical protein